MQHKEQILSAVEFRQPTAVPVSKQNGFPDKKGVVSSQHTSDNLQPGLVGKTRLEIPQETGRNLSGRSSVAGGESQYFKLQKLSSQQAVGPVRTTTETKLTRFPFATLFPFILPQLDEDKATQLRTLYEKLKKNEINRDQFVRLMGGIVGNEMLKLAAAKLTAQSGVPKTDIQVQTSTPKRHAGQGVGIIEPQSAKLLHQGSGSEETAAGSPLSMQVHPSKEKNAPSLRDIGCPMNNLSSSQATSSSAALNGSTLPHKPYVGQKKPLENPDSSSQPLSRKQKMSGQCEDQSIEQLIDVTAVSGVNLREEEEQLLSGLKEDPQVSVASLRALQEEEEKLILQKVPLQKKMAEIMAKCGMKNTSMDVERCLSMAVEERLRGLLSNLIRFSKQRIDDEKCNHETVITSDIRQHLMTLNRLAKEEFEKKEGEAEKLRKINEPENSDVPDDKKEKDEGRGKFRKVNKQEDDKMRTAAANFAARAAVGGDDLLSKWQLMAEQAQQMRGGSQVGSKPSSMIGKMTADSRVSGRGHKPLFASGTARRPGKNQMAAPQQGVSRSISIKDMISVLERETQMSKSTLIYDLYNRVPSNPAPDN